MFLSIVVLGLVPRALLMPGECATTEPHAQPWEELTPAGYSFHTYYLPYLAQPLYGIGVLLIIAEAVGQPCSHL